MARSLRVYRKGRVTVSLELPLVLPYRRIGIIYEDSPPLLKHVFQEKHSTYWPKWNYFAGYWQEDVSLI